MFVGSDSAIYATLITENAKPEELASSLAVHTVFAFGTAAISPLVFGIILDVFGRNELGWFIGFFTSSICALFAMMFLYLVYVRKVWSPFGLLILRNTKLEQVNVIMNKLNGIT